MNVLTRSSKKSVLKTLILVQSLIFVLPHLSWSLDPSSFSDSQTGLTHLGRVISIPKPLGKIEASYQGNDKTVICVQDLHCHYEVQSNIAEMIKYLNQHYNLRLIGEEGALKTINLDVIRDFPLQHIREQVSHYFMKNGRLTGAEYFTANHDQLIYLEGIDDKELYQESHRVLQTFLNSETQGFCLDIRDALESLKATMYNPVLSHHDQKKTAYDRGEIDLLRYAMYLKKAAQQAGIGLTNYLDYNYFIQHRQLTLAPEVDAEQLLKEIKQIDLKIREKMYSNDNQRQLDQKIRQIDLLEKLLAISVDSDELALYQQNRSMYRVSSFLDFIQQHQSEALGYFDRSIFSLDDRAEQAERFYRMTDQRSDVFVTNLLAKMETRGESLALMVSGGFHTQKILEELKRQGISYLSIKPHLTRQDMANPYFNLLSGKKSRLENLLVKYQTMFAPPVMPEQPQFDQVMEASYKPIALLELDYFSTGAQKELQVYLKKHQFLSFKPVEKIVDEQHRQVTIPTEVKVFQGYLKKHPQVAVPFVISKNYPDFSKHLSVKSDMKAFGPYQIAVLSSHQELVNILRASNLTTIWIDRIQEWLRSFDLKKVSVQYFKWLRQLPGEAAYSQNEAMPLDYTLDGISPGLKNWGTRLGLSPAAYHRWIDMMENKFLYAAGLLVMLTMVLLTGADISQGSTPLYQTVWTLFPYVSLMEGAVEKRSVTNFSLAGMISIINLGLLATPLSLLVMISLSYLSYGVMVLSRPWVTTSSSIRLVKKTMTLKQLLEPGKSRQVQSESPASGNVDELVKRNDPVEIVLGDRFDVSIQEQLENPVPIESTLTEKNTVLRVTLPSMYRRVVQAWPKNKTGESILYRLQAMIVGSVVFGKLKNHVRETQRLIEHRSATGDQETMFEYLGNKLIRLPLNRLSNLGQQPGTIFYQSKQTRQVTGITMAELTKLIENYRQQIEQAPPLWSVIYPGLERLLDNGNVPSPAILLEALEKTDLQTLDHLVAPENLDKLKLRVMRLQNRLAKIKAMSPSKVKSAEINHLIALMIESKQGLKPTAMPEAPSEVNQKELRLLIDPVSLREFKDEVAELIKQTGHPGLQSDLKRVQLILNRGGIMTTQESAQLQQAFVKMSLKPEERINLILGEDLSNYSGIALNGKVDVDQITVAGLKKKELMISQPVIINVLTPDKETISLFSRGMESLKKITVLFYQGQLPEACPVTGNFMRDLAEPLKAAPGFESALALDQPLADAYHRYLQEPTKPHHRYMVRVIGRILKRQIKKAAAMELQYEERFKTTLQVVNRVFQESELFGRLAELGQIDGKQFYVPKTLRCGGKLAFLGIVRQVWPDFVIDKKLESLIREERLKDFRMDTAA